MHDQKYFYDESETLTYDKNQFLIAAAVTGFDGNPEDITDPEIGELKFYKKQWGSGIDFGFEEIPNVPCPETEYFYNKEDPEKNAFREVFPVLAE
jgi:hypothetical protein